jgi:hypothetical protein
MTTRYAPCTDCLSVRQEGRWDVALHCHACGGKGVRRTPDSWACNCCGGPMCPSGSDRPHGLVEQVVRGGYHSQHLSDCTRYTFSMCESCLREMFASFVTPPDVDGEGSEGETYEHDVQGHAQQKEREERDAAKRADLVRQGRCCVRDQDGKYCGANGVMTVRYEGSATAEACCQEHGRDAFALSHMVVVADGEAYDFAARAAVGLQYLTAFAKEQEGTFDATKEMNAAVVLSTLFALVARPETFKRAARELRRVTGRQEVPLAPWTGHRVSMAFPSERHADAAVANAWLAWGLQQGYANAVAHALLGYAAANLWTKP